jgi:hypothetical protein
VLLREEGVSFQMIKTWKQSRDPDFGAKKNRVLYLYGLMDGTTDVLDGDPEVVICIDEFGPLNLQPHPGRQWTTRAAVGRGRGADGGPPTAARTACGTCWPPTTSPATGCMGTPSRASAVASSWCSCVMCVRCTRPGCDLAWCWTTTARICRPVTTAVGRWAAANNVELAYLPTKASWLNRIEAQFTALRSFAVDGTDHASHTEQASMIRRDIAWRNRNAHDRRLMRSSRRGRNSTGSMPGSIRHRLWTTTCLAPATRRSSALAAQSSPARRSSAALSGSSPASLAERDLPPSISIGGPR